MSEQLNRNAIGWLIEAIKDQSDDYDLDTSDMEVRLMKIRSYIHAIERLEG